MSLAVASHVKFSCYTVCFYGNANTFTVFTHWYRLQHDLFFSLLQPNAMHLTHGRIQPNPLGFLR
jgi:hypothetical protein